MKKFIFVLLSLAAFAHAENIVIENDIELESYKNEIWTWKCNDKGCEKEALADGGRPISVEVCRVACPTSGVLWPKPIKSTISTTLVKLDPYGLSIANLEGIGGGKEASEMIQGAFELFTERIRNLDKIGSASGQGFDIYFNVKHPENFRYVQGVNESYHLTVNPGQHGRLNATICSETLLGSRHALETLGQLIVRDSFSGSILTPSSVEIFDGPSYTHRGLTLDTARNFISVPAIKRTLDAMAASKLNTFHWHITDSHSFPFESRTFPNLTKYGAYSKNKIYTEKDIQDIIRFATVRGIRIVPEFDAPAHVGEGWQWVEDAVVCLAAEPWQTYCVEPPCGQLDPTSENTYKILDGIYSDLTRLFKSDQFHMGGDEVNIKCWESVDRITRNMKKMGLEADLEGYHTLWSKFQDRVRKILSDKAGDKVKPVLWTSTLTEGDRLTKFLNSSDYIIQIWTKMDDPTIAHLVNNSFQVIFSNYDALYFDCGFGAWVGDGNNWCSPYIPWQKVYENDPRTILSKLGIAPELQHLAIGAEAALWTEQADDSSIDNRFWPRASAMGEALWSGPGSWKGAEHRLLFHRERLVERGVQADTMQPQWCLQNQGSCYL
ncbi:unnamed protein product [Nezara viridula]|uniref:beta-N-acetylhexosaminidase n=1 Tax=Nezara viridula TaxID=85310 RepID=A0A9P0H3I3_NEZVI|nr:unnamed protein product [Nezara viridula]